MSHCKKLRVLILTHPDLIPPKCTKNHDLETAPWRCEYDVAFALRRMGHEVLTQGVLDDPAVIREVIGQWRPQIAFNLLEEFAGEGLFDQNVVSYLEMLRIPYTGCNPRGLMLARNKAVAKKLLSYHGILTPQFRVFPRRQPISRPKNFEFPIIVKSLIEEASLGIAQSSIVHNEESLVERVRFIHENIRTDAIAEAYIEGREFYVGVLGNRKIDAFPVWELQFRNAPDQLVKIATRRVKFDPEYQKKYGIVSGKARGLNEAQEQKIQQMCKDAYGVLGLNGYARMDLRLSDSGEVFLIEANPNPHLGREEDFAQSAKQQGVDYSELLAQILRLGMRWQPPNLTC